MESGGLHGREIFNLKLIQIIPITKLFALDLRTVVNLDSLRRYYVF